MSRVLIAADGTQTALHAAREAVGLVRDPQFVLVAVAPPTPESGESAGGFEGPIITPEEADELAERQQHDWEAALDATADALGLPDAERHVVHGDAGPMLVQVAEDMDADLLVMGTGDKGLLKRVFLGSVSQHVVHHAPCPVLVVRGLEADAAD